MSDTLALPPVHRPRLGNEGDPCPTCGALMASDQRYCLSCGSRRGTTRVPFPPEPVQAAPAPAAPLPPAPRREGPFAAYPPQLVGIVSGIIATSVLALGLLIGVLFAHKSNSHDDTPAAAAPTVIAGAPTATPAAGAAPPSTATFTSDWTSGDGWTIQLQTLPKGSTTPAQVAQAKSDAQGKGVQSVGALDSDAFAALDPGNYVIYSGNYGDENAANGALSAAQAQYPDAKVVHVSTSAGSETPAATPTASPTATPTAVTKTQDDLKKQKEQTPEQAQQNIKKAPPTESSAGKPPAKDNKKAGGGSSTTTFG
jgi:hypothetical protein